MGNIPSFPICFPYEKIWREIDYNQLKYDRKLIKIKGFHSFKNFWQKIRSLVGKNRAVLNNSESNNNRA